MIYGKPKVLKSYGKVSKEGCYYPPILDNDPELAASYLTISDSAEALEKMEEAFKLSGKYPVLEDSITYSNENLNWFSTFFSSLAKANCKTVSLLSKEVEFSEDGGLCFQYPFKHSYDNPVYHKINIDSVDPINKHRVMYISNHFSLEEFRGGYPIWYHLTDLTVYENYNEKLNARIKITHRMGEFMYYISGASDDWHQIHNVPIEMDYVVNALIFRN